MSNSTEMIAWNTVSATTPSAEITSSSACDDSLGDAERSDSATRRRGRKSCTRQARARASLRKVRARARVQVALRAGVAHKRVRVRARVWASELRCLPARNCALLVYAAACIRVGVCAVLCASVRERMPAHICAHVLAS
eukprot:6212970-Pleurochrysis_carterae.AAC.3